MKQSPLMTVLSGDDQFMLDKLSSQTLILRHHVPLAFGPVGFGHPYPASRTQGSQNLVEAKK
jgi:hypothetical protein